MEKKQMRKEQKMDMVHFLIDFYGISNNELLYNFSNLSHKEIKKIASLYGINLVRTNFEGVTKDQLLDGTIILVNDCYNNPAPYVNPYRKLNVMECDDFSVASITEEYHFDKKGRPRVLKRKVKFRKDDKHD